MCVRDSTGIFEEPNCNPNNLSHAVLLVGYGSEGGQDYWIIKNRYEKNETCRRGHWFCDTLHFFHGIPLFSFNLFDFAVAFLLPSWGTSWGEGGYMRMVRDGSNTCGIASYALFPIVWMWRVASALPLNSHTKLSVGLGKLFHSYPMPPLYFSKLLLSSLFSETSAFLTQQVIFQVP